MVTNTNTNTDTDTITTLAIISDEVYNENKKTVDYFADEYKPDGSKELKELIANNHTYKVLDHTPAQETGFNALLLQEKDTDKYVIAFRGTAEHFDIFDDALVGLKNYSFEFAQAKAFVSDMLKKHQIDKENLTLTGHSLGGILTQAVGAVDKIEGVAFNPYGVDRLLSMPPLPALGSPLSDIAGGLVHTAAYKVGTLFGLKAPQTAWAHEHITNVHYVDDGTLNGDPLSNLATELSSKHLGDSLLIHGENKGMDGHSMRVLNETLAEQNQLLKHFKGATLESLNRLYGVTGYAKTQEIFKELGVADTSPKSLRLESLHDKEIEEYDLQDPATLYALEHLNPFVVEGNLDAYKKIEIDNYSKEQLSDRVAFYYNKMHDIEQHHIRTKDMENDMASGYGNIRQEVVFGSAQNDNIKGTGKSDHLYGKEGNDILDGRGTYDNGLDNDHLEGGKGMDTLYGGKGDDVLIGGYGGGKDDGVVDLLYGGEGFDTYYVNNKDVISDSDGVGRIVFNGISLRGEKQKLDENTYIDAHFKYSMEDIHKVGRLTVTNLKTNESIAIEHFDATSKQLGIVLDKEKIKEPLYPTQTADKTQTPTTPKARTILTANNTTRAEDIIRADENSQPQNNSLLSSDEMIPNAQIAEFDTNESIDENNLTQTKENEKGAYLMGNDILLSSGPSATTAKDIKLSPEGYAIYEESEESEEIDDTKNNEDDYGMEM